MRLCILTIPFRFYARRFTKTYTKTSALNQKKCLGYARLIGRTVAKISDHTPWESKCLVQAMATKILLRRFRISNDMLIGVAYDEQDKFIAHAWIKVEDTVIVGGAKSEETYKVIQSFADTTIFSNLSHQ
jgi:hypothetical protein